MRKRRAFLLLAMVAVLSSACGVKGPLYLPEESETEEDKDKDDEKTTRRSPGPARTNHA